ncbi:MAG: ADP-ribosylglycohydrolase family protein [Armatimonadota bacterium]|nr:ADP-ribosylglycohydrolase family protein [Armatimonadota bacterium]
MKVNKCFLLILTFSVVQAANSAKFHELPINIYIDKMKGGWAGQMIGVSYGAPTEFKACGRTYEDPITWAPEQVANSLGQDDIYVELSFLDAIEKYGLDITNEQMGKAFASTKFKLWHANNEGRENVRKGIMPPDSGSPEYNSHYADIDFQIEADLFGLINPGMPLSSNKMCNKFGRIMNSGDGLYGGMFTAAMYTAAFFETDIEKIVRYGLRAIPQKSIYAQTIRDVITWHWVYPDDWRKTWQKVQEKWAAKPSGKCSTDPNGFNIDASLNGAYVVIGLLYGDGDLAKTLEISTRCGQDSDCNPATAAGVLCTAMGYSAIPDEYKSGISSISDKQFAFVPYNFNTLVCACEKLARECIKRAGGSVKEDVFLIPIQQPMPPKDE